MASPAGNGKPEPDSGGAPAGPLPPPPGGGPPADVENAVPDTTVASVVRRFKREDRLDKAALVLRALAWLFSALAFVVMASNSHGDWKEFNKYQEYRYVVAVSILALLYAAAQVVRRVLLLARRRDVLSRWVGVYVDFVGDQVAAYLLISASSAAIPITNRMREGGDNIFTDQSSASVTMAFFAFAAIALSALVSGFKISNQTYI